MRVTEVISAEEAISFREKELEMVGPAIEVPALLLSSLMRSEENTSATEKPVTEAILSESSTNPSVIPHETIAPLDELNGNSSGLSNAIDAAPAANDNEPIELDLSVNITANTTSAQANNISETAPANATAVHQPHNDNISIPVLKSLQSNVNSQIVTESTTYTSSSPTTPSEAEIILDEIESISKSPEPDNYIYETFSSVPPVVQQVMLDDSFANNVKPTNDQTEVAEEPPEPIAVDVAIAA